jgi:hypothetical protein
MKYGNLNQIITLENFNIPKILYRYTSVNEHTLNNLQENNLQATIPTEFNDLYDSTMHFDTASQYNNRILELNKSSINLGYDEIIGKELQEKLLEDAQDLDKHKLTYLTNDFRIVCLSANNRDIKMWSHYANKNIGICIAYYLTESILGINNFVYPVIYIEKPIDVTELCEDDNTILPAILVSIISKFKDWEHEKEWRIIFYIGESKDKCIPLINIPKPQTIFLGNRFIDNYVHAQKNNPNEFTIIEEFLDYIKKDNINLKIMDRQIRSFNLEYKDIEVDEIKKQILYR